MFPIFVCRKITAVQKNAVAIYQRIQEKPYISVQQVANYICAVSYTHLDVYKRQLLNMCNRIHRQVNGIVISKTMYQIQKSLQKYLQGGIDLLHMIDK